MIESNTTRKEKLGYRWAARWLADAHQLQTDKSKWNAPFKPLSSTWINSMLGQLHIFKVFVSFCVFFCFVFFYIFYLLVCVFLRATIMYSSNILLVDDFQHLTFTITPVILSDKAIILNLMHKLSNVPIFVLHLLIYWPKGRFLFELHVSDDRCSGVY